MNPFPSRKDKTELLCPKCGNSSLVFHDQYVGGKYKCESCDCNFGHFSAFTYYFYRVVNYLRWK